MPENLSMAASTLITAVVLFTWNYQKKGKYFFSPCEQATHPCPDPMLSIGSWKTRHRVQGFLGACPDATSLWVQHLSAPLFISQLYTDMFISYKATRFCRGGLLSLIFGSLGSVTVDEWSIWGANHKECFALVTTWLNQWGMFCLNPQGCMKEHKNGLSSTPLHPRFWHYHASLIKS